MLKQKRGIYGEVSYKRCAEQILIDDLFYQERNGWFTYIRCNNLPSVQINNQPNFVGLIYPEFDGMWDEPRMQWKELHESPIHDFAHTKYEDGQVVISWTDVFGIENSYTLKQDEVDERTRVKYF